MTYMGLLKTKHNVDSQTKPKNPFITCLQFKLARMFNLNRGKNAFFDARKKHFLALALKLFQKKFLLFNKLMPP